MPRAPRLSTHLPPTERGSSATLPRPRGIINRVATRSAISLLALLVGGCASADRSGSAAVIANETAGLRRTIEQIIDACETKDLGRLDTYHLYGPSFTKFDANAPARLDAAAARNGEHAGLTAANELHMQADNLDIQIFGDTGIATFLLDYRFRLSGDTIHKTVRTTLVFVKDHGVWKIVHEHLSPVPAPL